MTQSGSQLLSLPYGNSIFRRCFSLLPVALEVYLHRRNHFSEIYDFWVISHDFPVFTSRSIDDSPTKIVTINACAIRSVPR